MRQKVGEVRIGTEAWLVDINMLLEVSPYTQIFERAEDNFLGSLFGSCVPNEPLSGVPLQVAYVNGFEHLSWYPYRQVFKFT